ncbi:MAG: AAA family ATPase [Alphaproteobacteria bacterium]|jgi:Cdc6-like AAA superfamily ATPase|nr:AAA family ATPase [Alphaproteobacteria bacterium]MDP7222977.1 AAA family ATPase [Alphaproteobacteria bacterium]
MSLRSGVKNQRTKQTAKLVDDIQKLFEEINIDQKDSDELQAAVQQAPKEIRQGRGFDKIIWDDMMDAFYRIMATYLINSDVDETDQNQLKTSLKDLPHEIHYYLYRKVNEITADQDEAANKRAADKHLFQQVGQEMTNIKEHGRDRPEDDLPDFYQVIRNKLHPGTVSLVTYHWKEVISGFSALLMPDEGLESYLDFELITKRMRNEQQLRGNKMQQAAQQAGAANSGAGKKKKKGEKDPAYKILDVEEIGDLQEELDDLVGLEKPKALLPKLAASKKLQATLVKNFGADDKVFDVFNHYIFRGSPGTGKTTFARLIGKMEHDSGRLKKGHVVEVDAGDLIAGYVGQTAEKTSEAIQAALDGVLFIDEAYMLNDAVGSGKGFGPQAIATLVKDMELYKDRLTIIFAGYPKDMDLLVDMNSGLTRRTKTIDFEDYTQEQLMQIFDTRLEKVGLKITEDARNAVADRIEYSKRRDGKNFGNAGTVINILNMVIDQHAVSLDGLGVIDQFNAAADSASADLTEKLTMITRETVDSVDFANKTSDRKPTLSMS